MARIAVVGSEIVVLLNPVERLRSAGGLVR